MEVGVFMEESNCSRMKGAHHVQDFKEILLLSEGFFGSFRHSALEEPVGALSEQGAGEVLLAGLSLSHITYCEKFRFRKGRLSA